MDIKTKIMGSINKNKGMVKEMAKVVGVSIVLSVVACTYGTEAICAGIDKVTDFIKTKQKKGETLEEFFNKETEVDG